jgi:hypothetical protein
VAQNRKQVSDSSLLRLAFPGTFGVEVGDQALRGGPVFCIEMRTAWTQAQATVQSQRIRDPLNSLPPLRCQPSALGGGMSSLNR